MCVRDIHSHILPGVDDGSHDVSESLDMLRAAADAGVQSIVCTPHCRFPYFDYDAMWEAFYVLVDAAEECGLAYEGGTDPISLPENERGTTPISLQMGFEVNFETLLHLGLDWIDLLAFDAETAGSQAPTGVREFLLELPCTQITERSFARYLRLIGILQEKGYEVIIAHPERIRGILQGSYAERLVDAGCKLQLSADYRDGGRLGNSKEAAQGLLSSGLASYLASDAHYSAHYEQLRLAWEESGDQLRV